MTRAERQAFYDSPCVICGDRGDIEADHIVSRKNGGANARANLQPLCRVCNAIKRDALTNDQVREWIAANPVAYRQRKENRAHRLYLRVYGL